MMHSFLKITIFTLTYLAFFWFSNSYAEGLLGGPNTELRDAVSSANSTLFSGSSAPRKECTLEKPKQEKGLFGNLRLPEEIKNICDKMVGAEKDMVKKLSNLLFCQLDFLSFDTGIFLQNEFSVMTYDPQQMQTTLALVGKFIATKVDARASVEFATDNIGIGKLEKDNNFAEFAQAQLKEALGKTDTTLPKQGIGFFLEVSALPLLAVGELGAEGGAQLAGEAGAKALSNEIKKLFPRIKQIQETAKQLEKLTGIKIPNRSLLAEGALTQIENTAENVIKKFSKPLIDRNLKDMFLKDTVRKAFVGGYKVFNSVNSNVAIPYFKIGIDEQLIKSPLTNKMVVQSAHHLAGSSSSPMVALGLVHTLGEGRTLQVEVNAYTYRQPFNQPLIEFASDVGRISKNKTGDLSASVEAKYVDTNIDFDVTGRVAYQEGGVAAELHARKGLPFKKPTNLYLSLAHYEGNVNPKEPKFFGLIPMVPLQDSGATTSTAIMLAVDRQLLAGEDFSIHNTYYASMERNSQDVLAYGGAKLSKKNAIGASISYQHRYDFAVFNAYAGIELADIEFAGKKPLGYDDGLIFQAVAGGNITFGPRKMSLTEDPPKMVLEDVKHYIQAIIGPRKIPERKTEFLMKIKNRLEKSTGQLTIDIIKEIQSHPELKEFPEFNQMISAYVIEDDKV